MPAVRYSKIFWKIMGVFVTGGTGFIGSHFVNQCLSAGNKTVVLRRNKSTGIRIPHTSEPHWVNKQMIDVTEDDLAGIETLVHLAAHSANPPYDTIDECLFWNVTAPLKLFKTAHQAGVTRFVVAGSCFEYGESAEKYDEIPPDAALGATLTYPASKAAASIIFTAFAKETQSKLSIHRIFHAFGEGEQGTRLWPSLREAALSGRDYEMTDGTQLRDFVPVEHVATQLLQACDDNSIVAGEATIRNLGSGNVQSVKDFAASWWERWGAPGKLIIGAKPRRAGELSRCVPKL